MEMETKIEDTELNRALNDAKNLLEGLANLYFTTTSTTKSRLALNGLYQLVKWATLLIAGATTAWLYVEPSLAFGDRFNSKELGIAEVTGNVVCALLVTINISLAFITYLEKTGYAKEKLGKWREKTNRLLETTKNLAIVTGAAVSALPLAAPAWEFSTSYPLWLRVLQVAGIELAYTLVHTFPMMLLVQTNVKYILGAPFYALYFPLYKFPQLLLRSPTTLLAEQTKHDHQMLKNLLIGNLLAAVGKLTDHGFERDLKRLRYKAGEDAQKLPNIPNTPTNLSDITLGLEQYKCIIQTAQNMTPLAPRKLPKPIDYSREFVRTIVWTLGALLVTIGISGFAGSEYNLTERMLDSRVAAILITLLPVLITAIMVAYYGGKAFQRPFDTATALITRNTAMPVAFRLYPKAFLFLQFLNVFVFSPFSSGPATELVYTNIPESWGIGREFLAQTAFWGVIVYCIINLNDILCSGIMHYASQFGGQYTRMMAVLIERATAFCLAINMMDGNALEETLKQLPDDTKKLLLGIDLNRFSKICDHTGNLKESLAQGGWLLWKKPTADDIDALQNLNTFSNNL